MRYRNDVISGHRKRKNNSVRSVRIVRDQALPNNGPLGIWKKNETRRKKRNFFGLLIKTNSEQTPNKLRTNSEQTPKKLITRDDDLKIFAAFFTGVEVPIER
jgi:hypothetical protein